MTRVVACLALFFTAFVTAQTPVEKIAEKPKEVPAAKVLLDEWQVAYFEGIKVGHGHTLVTQTGVADKARIRTQRKMTLIIKRYGSVLAMKIEETSVESLSGKVLSLGVKHKIGESPEVVISGKVEGKSLLIRTGDDEEPRKVPWDDEAIGLYSQEAIFAKKKAKTGDKVKLVTYELILARPMVFHMTVKGIESVDRLDATMTDGMTKVVRTPVKLLRADATPDPIKIGTTMYQGPSKAIWLDAKLMPLRSQFEMPGLGLITMYNTTRDAALKEGIAPDRLPDIGLNISIPLKQTIDEPYSTTEAVYKITLKEKIPTVFTTDRRQSIREEKGNSFELVVKAVRQPGANEKAKLPAKEYFDSNFYIDSDDKRIQNLARGIIRKETDPWKKAVLLEKWVHDKMKTSSAPGFPSASRIARDLEGDCRQHALLLVALCRAAGVPSRTAVGLIYAREQGRSPIFGFHMWAEVWVRGRWVGLDAILGQGGVAATHLKMADLSWSKTTTLVPLLPISRTLGKIQIEVLESK